MEYTEDMDSAMVYIGFALTLLVFCFGIYVWGRGIVMASRGDQIAGPVLFVVMCVVSGIPWGSGGSIISGLMATVFGLTTLLCIVMARRMSIQRRVILLLVGLGAAVLGVLGCVPAL